MTFEVLTVVKMTMLVIWVVTPCGLVGRYQRFGQTYCLHLQVCIITIAWRWEQSQILKSRLYETIKATTVQGRDGKPEMVEDLLHEYI
jgi:uncharacterized membrane protein YqjE